MPANVEIKAKLRAPSKFVRDLMRIGARQIGTLEQEDTFFNVPRGRLKIRYDPNLGSEMVYYVRPMDDGPRISHYFRQRLDDAEDKRGELASRYGVLGIVKKRRDLFLVGDVRFHIDRVEGLGTYLEIEVPVDPKLGEHRARYRASRLVSELGIPQETLVGESYDELIRSRPSKKALGRISQRESSSANRH